MEGKREIEIKRMLHHYEHQISEMNSTSISAIAGDIKKSDFLDLARSISILRAKYLKTVLRLAHARDDELNFELGLEVKRGREAYLAARESFEHLKYALQRGYFNLIDS